MVTPGHEGVENLETNDGRSHSHVLATYNVCNAREHLGGILAQSVRLFDSFRFRSSPPSVLLGCADNLSFCVKDLVIDFFLKHWPIMYS